MSYIPTTATKSGTKSGTRRSTGLAGRRNGSGVLPVGMPTETKQPEKVPEEIKEVAEVQEKPKRRRRRILNRD